MQEGCGKAPIYVIRSESVILQMVIGKLRAVLIVGPLSKGAVTGYA